MPDSTGNGGIGTINWADVLKGLIVAALTTFLTTLQQFFFNAHRDTFFIDWKVVWIATGAAVIAYLLKQLGSDKYGRFLGKVG